MIKKSYFTFAALIFSFALLGTVTNAQVSTGKVCNQDPQGLGDPNIWYCTPTNPAPEGCTNQTNGDMTCYMPDPPAGYTNSNTPVPTTADQTYQQYVQDQAKPAATTQTATKLSYSPLEPLPGLENVQDLNFATFLSLVFKILITVGALLSVGTLVYAGISYMLSEAFETKGEAKRRMQAALWGMIILLGAWLLLNTINPQLLNFNLSSIGSGQSTNNSGSPSGNNASLNSSADIQKQILTCPGKPERQSDGSIKCIQ